MCIKPKRFIFNFAKIKSNHKTKYKYLCGKKTFEQPIYNHIVLNDILFLYTQLCVYSSLKGN